MTYEDYKLFRDVPHVFGHYLGYKDLIEQHSEWIYDAWIYDTPSMQAHRNSYKTTSILILGFVWYNIFINQDETCLFIRKARDEVWKIIKAIKNIFESKNVEYIMTELDLIKPGQSIKTDNWSNGSITLSTKRTVTPEGSLDGIGMGGAITGSHYDKIFPDDIITLKDRVSKAERETTKDYVRELRNIIKEGGKLFFSGTPWHKDDAWNIIPEPKIFPIGSLPIKGYTDDKIEEKKTELRSGTTSSLYAANYELKHIASEDVIFNDPKFDIWADEFRILCGWVDPSYSGNNTTAMSMLGQSKDERWHVRGWVWTNSIEECYEEIVENMKRYKAGTLYVEVNADKGMSKRDLLKLYPTVEGRHEKENKHVRIIGYAKKHWDSLHFAHDCQSEFLNQILDYQEGEEPDDAPDALAGIMRELGFTSEDGEVFCAVC